VILQKEKGGEMIWFSTILSIANAIEIQHEFYQLDNGLKVILIEDHSLPKIVVDTWYGVGSFDDPTGASGFAHLFEHLMFMGTERIPEKEFDQRMESGGGWNNASTGDDRTNYYDVGSSELVDLLLFMEADRMTGLDITQPKLDLQREVVRNERRQNYEDAPYGKVWLEVPEMLFPQNHPYYMEGIGSHEHLLAATLDTVNNFYSDWYVPNNATLCVAGDFDPTHVKNRIEEWYGPLKAKEKIEHQKVEIPQQPVVKEKTVTDNITLPALIMLWHSPVIFQEGDADADILSSVLSGQAKARLTAKLVYEEQTVQEVSVFQWSRMRGSVFVVYVDAKPEADLDKIKQIVQQELDAIASGEKPVTEQELKAIINNWEMGFLWGLEDVLERAETLQSYAYYIGKPGYLQEDLKRYQNVTPESIQRIVAQYFTGEKSATLRVLPEEEKEVKP
jgi:zinc protease